MRLERGLQVIGSSIAFITPFGKRSKGDLEEKKGYLFRKLEVDTSHWSFMGTFVMSQNWDHSSVGQRKNSNALISAVSEPSIAGVQALVVGFSLWHPDQWGQHDQEIRACGQGP